MSLSWPGEEKRQLPALGEGVDAVSVQASMVSPTSR